MLKIDQMTINRVVVHTIPARGPDKSYVPPSGGADVLHLNGTVSDVVVARMSKALGHNSHGVQADFEETADDSAFSLACSMMDCTDTDFKAHAQAAAEKLTKVQLSKSFSAAKLISMSGSVGTIGRPFAAFIKADLEQALSETTKQGQSVLDVLNDLFLTESQRLYKIGFFLRTAAGTGKKAGAYVPEHHSVHVYDHLMTGTESRNAAFYFYSEFLGANVAASDRRLTQDFFEKSLKFFDEKGFSQGKRIALGEALRAELRSNKQTLNVSDFAQTHLQSAKDQSDYVAYMQKSGFPAHAITKDVDYVKNRLRRRQKVYFDSDVVISTPADAVKELLKFKDNHDGTTTVTVQGTVESNG
jgi:hypothetical protein